MTLSVITLYVITGTVAGFLAGLFGVGGGLIVVPALLYCFFLQGFETAISMHLAIGTSLATIILTSISSARAHHAHAAVQWRIVKLMTAGILAGGFLGALIAKNLSSDWLRYIFAVFEILVAVKLYTNANVLPDRLVVPGQFLLNIAAVIISTVSAIVGIGGGTLSVPFLRWTGLSIKKSIATSAALGLPIAVSGTLAFIWTGASNPSLPEYAMGFVYLPALFFVGLLSILLAPLGARCAHNLPERGLQQVFALGLLLIALLLLLGYQ